MFLSSSKNYAKRLCKLSPQSTALIPFRNLNQQVELFGAQKLKNRKVVRVSGESSSDFLQGLITNDMRYLDSGSSSIYTLFLNNKGRILYDAIIYKTDERGTFLLDCDTECVDQFKKHLKVYKLRKKIDIIDSEYSVWAVYNDKYINDVHNINESPKVDAPSLKAEDFSSKNNIFVVDPRLPFLGYRALINFDEEIKNLPLRNNYRICRFKLGVGEGVEEFQIGQSFPLEMNCDYLNGVSFEKGCYIGQELTARTHHTGVVRKRLMPLMFDVEPKNAEFNSSLESSTVNGKAIGKLKGYCGQNGLGLMRVSESLDSKSIKILDYVAKTWVPFWWPPISLQQKYVKSNKQ